MPCFKFYDSELYESLERKNLKELKKIELKKIKAEKTQGTQYVKDFTLILVELL